MKTLLLICLILFATAPPSFAGWRDSIPSDTSTATFGDPSKYIDNPEKPLWFFLDSLARAAGWLPEVPDDTTRPPRVSTRTQWLGWLEGFDLSRVGYVMQFSRDPHVDSLQTGTLFLLEIWPSLYHLIAHFAPIDEPDTAVLLNLPDQEALAFRWRSDEDSSAYDWEQIWVWNRLEGEPVNLKFAPLTQRALDQALPAGYYAPFAGLLDDSTLCFTAPVYRPTDQFGVPTGGEVTLCYRLEQLSLRVASVTYSRPK